jgi:hypothetical protein
MQVGAVLDHVQGDGNSHDSGHGAGLRMSGDGTALLDAQSRLKFTFIFDAIFAFCSENDFFSISTQMLFGLFAWRFRQREIKLQLSAHRAALDIGLTDVHHEHVV